MLLLDQSHREWPKTRGYLIDRHVAVWQSEIALGTKPIRKGPQALDRAAAVDLASQGSWRTGSQGQWTDQGVAGTHEQNQTGSCMNALCLAYWWVTALTREKARWQWGITCGFNISTKVSFQMMSSILLPPAKHPHNTLLSPPCFTAGMVLFSLQAFKLQTQVISAGLLKSTNKSGLFLFHKTRGLSVVCLFKAV